MIDRAAYRLFAIVAVAAVLASISAAFWALSGDSELPVEQPGSGQLRVRVHAAGVGSTDLIMLAGKYAYAPKMPFVPAYEIAGVRVINGGSGDCHATSVHAQEADIGRPNSQVSSVPGN